MCGGIFKKGVPEEEAWAEHDRKFPGETHETAEIVCDDCYQQMMAVQPPPGMENETYGRSPGLEAIEVINDYLQTLRKPPSNWFRIKINRPWWWHLLHPILSRKIKAWMVKLEEFLQGESEHIDFEKKVQKYMEDLLIYGEAKTEL